MSVAPKEGTGVRVGARRRNTNNRDTSPLSQDNSDGDIERLSPKKGSGLSPKKHDSLEHSP